MKEKKLKVFALPIEEFEKKYPVSYSIVVPEIPEGHVAKVVSVRPCQTFIILKDKTIEQYDEIPVADAYRVASVTGILRFTPRPCSAHRPYDT